MPSNYTEHYQLNLWEAEDKVQRVDFNADNAKIDAAIHAVAQKADSLSSGKAEQSALTAEVNTRTSQVNALNAKVAKLGNCEIYHATYVGDGESTRSLTFPRAPLLVFIMGASRFMKMAAGVSTFLSGNGMGAGTYGNVVWSGNTVTWSYISGSYNSKECGNSQGTTYHVFALIDAAG